MVNVKDHSDITFTYGDSDDVVYAHRTLLIRSTDIGSLGKNSVDLYPLSITPISSKAFTPAHQVARHDLFHQYVRISSRMSSSIMKMEFGSLFNADIFSDVTIRTHGGNIFAHKVEVSR
jgi:hypothetical protein